MSRHDRGLEPVSVVGYDEFGFLEENAGEAGLTWAGPPHVERHSVQIDDDVTLSALAWGQGEPELVFLHGGGQNAHTWDTVALAMDRPLVAIDLPGHGRSSWRPASEYQIGSVTDSIGEVCVRLAPAASAVIGMSLGGLVALRLAAARPELVRRLVIVDVTPAVEDRSDKLTPAQRGSSALGSAPWSYPTFDAMLQRTHEASPHRSLSSLRRGVLHNARPLPDGRWAWRADPDRHRHRNTGEIPALWNDVERIGVPTLLVCGGDSSFVPEDHRAEFCRRLPGTRVAIVDGAGHSVQGDRPLELARLIEDFVFGRASG